MKNNQAMREIKEYKNLSAYMNYAKNVDGPVGEHLVLKKIPIKEIDIVTNQNLRLAEVTKSTKDLCNDILKENTKKLKSLINNGYLSYERPVIVIEKSAIAEIKKALKKLCVKNPKCKLLIQKYFDLLLKTSNSEFYMIDGYSMAATINLLHQAALSEQDKQTIDSKLLDAYDKPIITCQVITGEWLQNLRKECKRKKNLDRFYMAVLHTIALQYNYNKASWQNQSKMRFEIYFCALCFHVNASLCDSPLIEIFDKTLMTYNYLLENKENTDNSCLLNAIAYGLIDNCSPMQLPQQISSATKICKGYVQTRYVQTFICELLKSASTSRQQDALHLMYTYMQTIKNVQQVPLLKVSEIVKETGKTKAELGLEDRGSTRVGATKKYFSDKEGKKSEYNRFIQNIKSYLSGKSEMDYTLFFSEIKKWEKELIDFTTESILFKANTGCVRTKNECFQQLFNYVENANWLQEDTNKLAELLFKLPQAEQERFALLALPFLELNCTR